MPKEKSVAPEASVFRGVVDLSIDEIPPPPYMLGGVDFMFCGVRYDSTAVQQILPPELKPQPGCTGTFGIYSVERGWGIAPWNAFFVAIEVQGFDSPDGTHGYYMATGYFSDRGGQVMRSKYNQNFLEGGSTQTLVGDTFVGTGGPDWTGAVEMRIRPVGERLPPSAGTHHYIGRNPAGGLNFYAVAFTCDAVWNAEAELLKLGPKASDRLRMLGPTEVLWALRFEDVAMTISAPRLISEGRPALDSTSGRAFAVSLFAKLGRAAIVVGKQNRLEFMNPAAEVLLPDLFEVRSRTLHTLKTADQHRLESLLRVAEQYAPTGTNLHTELFHARDGRPIIAEALSIDRAVTGDDAVVLLLSDPGNDARTRPEPALQLLGLTPAEARIAALVGAGKSPREVALAVGNSESTVRTSLKCIYSKLQIGRQAELARIVTRLENIGSDQPDFTS